jgi:hypothetical protein
VATLNPFANDDVQGEIWERGYLAGFNRPDKVNFPGPLSAELMEVFRRGESDGRNDRNSGIGLGETVGQIGWVQPDFGELPEHLMLHALGFACEKLFRVGAFTV